MKKLLALLLALSMVFTLVACGGGEKEPGSEKEPGGEKAGAGEDIQAKYATMTAEDLIKEFIKDEANPTNEELIALAKTGAYGTIGEKNVFERNITDEALAVFEKKEIEGAYATGFAKTLIEDENAMVRAYAYNSFSEYVPLDYEELENFLIEKATAETDTVVVACVLNGLKNALSERSEFADFAVECAKHEDASIRYWSAMVLGFYRLDDDEKYVDAMIALMQDSDVEVAKYACKKAGSLHSEKVVATIETILADEALVDLHGPATEALQELWMGYPFYEGKSEAAYRAHMAYLNTDSTNAKIPSWLAIASITNPGGKFEDWKAASTYFKAEELVAALSKIVCDADVDKLAKTTAIQKIGKFGTAADLEALKAAVSGDDSLVSKIDSELANK